MKLTTLDPPRIFEVGDLKKNKMKDCAGIALEPNEQVTFTTDSGTEFDVARKVWGYYATPSLNGRLKQFGLHAVLVKNPQDKYFIWLVEKGKEPQFQEYLTSENHVIVCRLDNDDFMKEFHKKINLRDNKREYPLHCPCGADQFKPVYTYEEQPEGEICFQFSSSDGYLRQLLRCDSCGHYISVHDMDTGDLYSEEYVNSTYKDEDGVRKTFKKIISLDPSRSDNMGRVKCVLDYASSFFSQSSETGKPSILDIGSGLCVFLYCVKEAGWDCTALDPDPRAVEHARSVVGVKGICGDFMKLNDLGRFDVLTFNKVLEHVVDPVAMLARSAAHLKRGGVVYIELPDGEAAITEGPGREEFFIDHMHIFSTTSLSLLIRRSGFRLLRLERLQEPSSKYTLRAFMCLDLP